MSNDCPFCGQVMSDCCGSEPECEDGYWCDECGMWFSADEIIEMQEEENAE